MTGLGKRVSVGFLSIVCLLFFSGMVSLFELSHLSRDTEDILKASQRNIELAKEMLDAAHEQNVALIHIAVFNDISYDSICRANMDRLEQTLRVAEAEAIDKSLLDSLSNATQQMRTLTDNYLAFGYREILNHLDFERLDTIGNRWYTTQYEDTYRRLTSAVKSYMTSTQSSLAPRAEQMQKNAYRAVTPVLISLGVMIAIVLVLFYFMRTQCVNPIIRINRALKDYLTFHIPFNVKGELKDELLEIKERIESVISGVKSRSKL